MADDGDMAQLTNGDMQDAETHEMVDMNGEEAVEPVKGRKNDGFEGEEETEHMTNGHTETATEYENHEGGTINTYENATYDESTRQDENGDGLVTPKYTPPGSPTPEAQYSAINMENGEVDDKARFVQHEGADDETTRAESRAKFKRKRDYKCVCLSVLCFTVMILAAAFAFFVAMFAVGSLDGFFNKDSSSGQDIGAMDPPERPSGTMIAAPPIQMITTMAQISITLDWKQVYDFPSSPERQELENGFLRDADSIFRWGITEYVYYKTEIAEFRRGPFGKNVFVEFTSYFYNTPDGVIKVPEGTVSPSIDELYEFAQEDMSKIVFELLAAAIDARRFRSVTVELGTLQLLYTEVTRGTSE